MLNHPPVPITDLAQHVGNLRANDGARFSLEYESIDPGQQFTWDASNLEINKPKNRYANVIAYDHSRVLLQPIDGIVGSDYINANYMDGFRKQCAYIATQVCLIFLFFNSVFFPPSTFPAFSFVGLLSVFCEIFVCFLYCELKFIQSANEVSEMTCLYLDRQGPLPDTFGDFWRMVWEQRTSTVVMMTKLEERSRVRFQFCWRDKERVLWDVRRDWNVCLCMGQV